MKKLTFFILLSLSIASLFAQKRKAKMPVLSYSDIIVKKYTDSLTNLRSYYDSTWTYQGVTLKNPYLAKIFFQPTLYNSPISQKMDNDWVGKYNRILHPYKMLNTQDEEVYRDSVLNQLLADFYISHPNLVKYTEQDVQNQEGIREEAIATTTLKHEVSLAEKIKPAEPEAVVEPLKIVSHRPNFWSIKANTSLGLTQFYQSNNYPGGTSKYANLQSTFTIWANYNYNDKFMVNNTISARIGFQTNRSDTIHSIHPSDNELRMVNSFELRAIKRWNYSLVLTSVTPVLTKYNVNSHYVTTDFFSPYNLAVALGMRFNPNWKKFKFSANLSPLTFDFRYVGRKKLEQNYGLKKDHHFNESYGSSVTLNWTWQVFKELGWTSRMYYYSNYSRVQWEWENTFNFTINKYLSTRLYLYPRFEDTRKDYRGRYRIQLRESLSLGFNYSF